MPIINNNIWNKYVETNKDGYSKVCIQVAKRVMEKLDENPEPLHKGYYPDPLTPHGLICLIDNEIDAGDISGFQASAVTQMIFECHSRGTEFKENS